ncbi:NupC family protein [Vibrio cholerae]|nr:NupC family protein [Vibrio cholerae]
MSVIALLNGLLGWFGGWFGIELSFELIMVCRFHSTD